MAFQVVFHPRARSDIAATVAWLASKSPTAAARWRSSLLRIVEKLETGPNQYPTADEAADLGVELRQLLHGRRRSMYRILFTIDGQTVNVLRIRHASQDHLGPDDV